MDDERKHVWEPDELQRVLRAHHAEFDEQCKILMAGLGKPFPGGELYESKPFVWKKSAATIEADARLKALQEYVRNLPRRNLGRDDGITAA